MRAVVSCPEQRSMSYSGDMTRKTSRSTDSAPYNPKRPLVGLMPLRRAMRHVHEDLAGSRWRDSELIPIQPWHSLVATISSALHSVGEKAKNEVCHRASGCAVPRRVQFAVEHRRQPARETYRSAGHRGRRSLHVVSRMLLATVPAAPPTRKNSAPLTVPRRSRQTCHTTADQD